MTESVGNRHQHLVADGMPILVVDELEFVEVDEQQRDVVASGLDPTKSIGETESIGEVGERVLRGRLLEGSVVVGLEEDDRQQLACSFDALHRPHGNVVAIGCAGDDPERGGVVGGVNARVIAVLVSSGPEQISGRCRERLDLDARRIGRERGPRNVIGRRHR